MYLKDFNKKEAKDSIISEDNYVNADDEKKMSINRNIIDQMKNTSQQDEIKPKFKSDEKNSKLLINNFEELIELCTIKKEIKLKYELESNINLVAFDEGRIEIAFNENLDKNFVKDLTFKLHEWTGQRWIITFSKKFGQLSKKQNIVNEKLKNIEEAKNEEVYKKVLDALPDAELFDINLKDKE